METKNSFGWQSGTHFVRRMITLGVKSHSTDSSFHSRLTRHVEDEKAAENKHNGNFFENNMTLRHRCRQEVLLKNDMLGRH